MTTLGADGVRVLHVDDEPSLADVVATYLERENDRITVETAHDADEGLETLREGAVDCIVSDYNMPGMDGVEFLRAVREEYPDIPFLLFTGRGSEEVASDAISAGATDYLQKGSGTEQYGLLANRILNAVGQYRSKLELGETREEYAAVFENARDGLLLVDVEDEGFRYRRANPEAVDLIGRDSSEIVGHAPAEALGPENGRKVVGAYRACVDRHAPLESTLTLDLPVGEVIWDCKVTPVGSNGDAEELVVGFHDITDQRRRQRELEAERRFSQQALDALEDLFYVLDTDGALRRWNARAVEVAGYTASELAEMTATDLFPEDERPAIEAAIETIVSERSTTVEADLLTADDRRIPYEFAGARLTDGDGTTTGLVGIGRDLTERRQRERRFQALVEESDDIVSVLDADGRVQYQSPSVERVLGHDQAATAGDLAWEYVHPDDRETIKETFAEWIEAPNTTSTLEYRARHADGSWRWMEARGNNKLDDPAVEGYIVNSRDITDRKRRQRELRRIKNQYQTLVDNFPDGAVYLFDRDCEYVRAGGQELSAVGLSSEEVEGSTPSDLFAEEVAEETLGQYRATLDGDRRTFEQAFAGERYRIQTVPVRDEDGAVRHGMAVSQNITDRTERRRELTRQNERLNEFASIVSHELSNPLLVATSEIELARDAGETDRLDRALDALDRGQALIDDLLTLAREGETVEDPERVSLPEIAETSWQTVETGEMTLAVDTEQAVFADRTRLRELFENLYRNALEHGGEGVTVSVGSTETGFYVADTGAGIPADERETVFDVGHSRKEHGTGFGLQIVEQVVAAHGWEIVVTDGEAGGARFEITDVETVDR